MNTENSIKILEGLILGFSATTGEVFNEESVLKDPMIIQALEQALEALKTIHVKSEQSVKITENEIQKAIQSLKNKGLNPTAKRLSDFMLGNKKIENSEMSSDELYGKFQNIYTEAQLQSFFKSYLTSLRERKIEDETPWEKIDFFKKTKFNSLTQETINELKEEISEIGISQTENLRGYVETARKNYPRAYEPWSEKEKMLLKKAMEHTNNLTVLSEYFQRGSGAIESCGKKIIYEEAAPENKQN